MPCFLSCKSKSVLAKPLEHQCSVATISPGLGSNSGLATPRAVFEGLSLPPRLLDRRNVLPGLVVARTISMMQCIEDPKLRLPRRIQDLQHMRDAVIRFCNSPNAVP